LSARLPYLEMLGPEGQHLSVQLSKERIKIGRLSEHNEVALEPDPQQLVTRVAHCAVERVGGTWWVVDNGSVNKTFLQTGHSIKIVQGRERLSDGDTIRILARLSESHEPAYWKITFHDPMKTFRAEIIPTTAYLEYDWIQARLFRVDTAIREEILSLRPQEHKLIRYMDQRNRANGNVPVLCTYEELIAAIWGDESFGHGENEINRLVWELRQKIEPGQKEPRFLETARGLGYRLVTRPLSA
jgi:hypothetical protein